MTNEYKEGNLEESPYYKAGKDAVLELSSTSSEADIKKAGTKLLGIRKSLSKENEVNRKVYGIDCRIGLIDGLLEIRDEGRNLSKALRKFIV